MHGFFIIMARVRTMNKSGHACMGTSRVVVNYYYATAGSQGLVLKCWLVGE
jgi:hypothetical protein